MCIRDSLEDFLMWRWRRGLRILWTGRVLNDEVSRRVDAKRILIETTIGKGEAGRILIETIVERTRSIVGHLVCHSNWFNTLIEWMIEGHSGRGRPRQEYMAEIKGGRRYMIPTVHDPCALLVWNPMPKRQLNIYIEKTLVPGGERVHVKKENKKTLNKNVIIYKKMANKI